MTPLPILDLIAGMIFLYFLMSILCNSVIEGLVAMSRVRATMLTKWIQENLPKLSSYYLNHTLLDGPHKGNSTTSYISSKNFAFVLIDAITKEAEKLPTSLDQIEEAIEVLEKKVNDSPLPADLARVLRIFIAESRDKAKMVDQTKTELELFRNSIEVWFDSMMERVGGSFKKWTSKWTFVISLVVVTVLNIDGVQIAKYLYANEEARNKLAMTAYEGAEDPSLKVKSKSAKQMVDSVSNVPDSIMTVDTIGKKVALSYTDVKSSTKQIAFFIPIGWNLDAEEAVYKASRKRETDSNVCMFGFWLQKVFGLLMSIFAVMLGAPFWFDVLGKVANLRSSIKPAKAQDSN